jgi:hypothetical protein
MIQPITQAGVVSAATLAALNQNFALIFPTQGNVYWVRPRSGSDAFDGLTSQSAFQTLARAMSAAVPNQNDVVFLCAESNTAAQTTDYQDATLDWNKDLVHLIGIGSGPFLGQRARISARSTAAALAPLFKLSANGCLISGVEFFQGTPASGTTSRCVDVTGQRNHIVNCQMSGMGDLTAVADVAGSRSIKLSGSENVFQHCYIGLDTAIRATMTTEVEISAGARNTFENCHFETYTSLSTFKMVSVATGCDRFVKFVDCDFVAVQNITSAVAPTGAIGITTMNGQVIMRNPYLYGFAQYVTADNAYVQVLGFIGTATSHLVGIAQGVDAT